MHKERDSEENWYDSDDDVDSLGEEEEGLLIESLRSKEAVEVSEPGRGEFLA